MSIYFPTLPSVRISSTYGIPWYVLAIRHVEISLTIPI